MPTTCPHCGDDILPGKSFKAGARVVCPSCFRSFQHEGAGPAAPLVDPP